MTRVFCLFVATILGLFFDVAICYGQNFVEIDEVEGDQPNSNFTRAIAYSNNTAVVGCENCGSSGEVFVYERSGSSWVLLAELTASTPETGETFGRAVDIKDDVIAVGNRLSRVYVYEKPMSGWIDMTETAILTSNNSALRTGELVKITENYILAMNEASSDNNKGVSIFEKSSSSWSSMSISARIARPSSSVSNQFGRGIDAYGDTIIVANADNSDPGYLFFKPSMGWSTASAITTPDVTLEATSSVNTRDFARFAAINQKHAYIGVEGYPIHIYERPTGGWGNEGSSAIKENYLLSPPFGASFQQYGFSVDLVKDSVLAVGYPDVGNGSVELFYKGIAGWSSKSADEVLTSGNGASGDRFGISVSFDETGDLIIGADQTDRNTQMDVGSLYYFEIPTFPTFSSFNQEVSSTFKNTEEEITLNDLLSASDATDSDGSITNFVIQSVTSGSLRIGSDKTTASAYASGTNDEVDANQDAYWTPENDATGNDILAFEVIVRDNNGHETTSSVAVPIDVIQLRINEVFTNVTNVSDLNREYFELYGTPDATIPDSTYFTFVSGQLGGVNQGNISHSFQLGGKALGSNGYLVYTHADNTLTINSGSASEIGTDGSLPWKGLSYASEFGFLNFSMSYLLLRSNILPNSGIDYDSDEDGALDGDALGWNIIDGVGVIDGGLTDTGFAPINFARNGNGISPNTIIDVGDFFPGYLARNGNSTGSEEQDWIVGSVLETSGTFELQDSSPELAIGQALTNLGTDNPHTIFWLGANNDWTDSNNWSDGDVPDQTDRIVIKASGNDPQLTGSRSILDVELKSGASIQLSSGSSLAIYGNTFGSGSISATRNIVGSAGLSMIGAPFESVDFSDLSADYLYSFDGSSYQIPSGTMMAGEGYFVGYNTAAPAIAMTGSPNADDVTINVPANEFKILSNPYLAPISFASFDAAAGATDGNIWLWDDGGTNTAGDRFGDYVTVNSLGTTAANNGSTGNTFSGSIASFQGFFVKGNAAGGDVIFTQTMQDFSNGNADGSHFRTIDDLKTLKLSFSRGECYNEILIAFTDVATDQIDRGMDAPKFSGNENFSFYSEWLDQKFAILALPELVGQASVDLGFTAIENGWYNFKIEDMSQLEGYSIILKDRIAGQTYDLKNQTHTFFLGESRIADNRFQIFLAREVELSEKSTTSELLVLGDQNNLTIYHSKEVGFSEVAIYTLEGRVAFKANVNFQNQEVTINPNLLPNFLYVLKVGDQEIKFIIN